MTTTQDPCATGDCNEPITTLLGADPFTALRPHFGMLLGVDDFEVLDANPRGKIRLHNAWLHGEGAVWGLAVQMDRAAGEVEVFPGLGLDAAGRELYLAGKVCLSLSKWIDEHADELETAPGDTDRPFLGHVVIRSSPCLTRSVPAFADSCNGADSATAYSRVEEGVEVVLRPGPAPRQATFYHRLRLLFGVDLPATDEAGEVRAEDREVLAEIDRIGTLPQPEQAEAALWAFRRFAAFDTIDRRPGLRPDEEGDLLYPAGDDCELVLAEIRANIRKDGTVNLEKAWCDVTDRPSHVATRTVQELLLGSTPAGRDAGGPRIDAEHVVRAGLTVSLPVTKPIHDASATPNAVTASTFTAGGWQAVAVDAVRYDPPTSTLKVKLHAAPAGDILRLIARGTGDAPLLGTDLIPLAGSTGGAPGSVHDGHDAVVIVRS